MCKIKVFRLVFIAVIINVFYILLHTLLIAIKSRLFLCWEIYARQL